MCVFLKVKKMLEPSSGGGDWYKNPLFAFLSGCAAGAAFAYTVLFPAYLGSANFEIAEARQENARTATYETKIRDLSNSLKTAQEALVDYQYKDLLVSGSPYPLGLASAAISNDVDVVKTQYTQHEQNESDGYISVKLKDGVFTHAVYYFGDDRRIYQIALRFTSLDELIDESRKGKFDKDFVQRQLVKALGEPTSNYRRWFYWRLPSGEGVYKDDDYGFLIMKKGMKPAAWPSEAFSLATGTRAETPRK